MIGCVAVATRINFLAATEIMEVVGECNIVVMVGSGSLVAVEVFCAQVVQIETLRGTKNSTVEYTHKRTAGQPVGTQRIFAKYSTDETTNQYPLIIV